MGAEELVTTVVGWLRLAIDAVSALVIGFGVGMTIYTGIRARLREGSEIYQKTRVRLGHFLVLGLELQLASDLLGTTIAPSWQEIGQLAAIAAIRTFLNIFLQREQREMEAEMARQSGPTSLVADS